MFFKMGSSAKFRTNEREMSLVVRIEKAPQLEAME
jgi:hypothetical protein